MLNTVQIKVKMSERFWVFGYTIIIEPGQWGTIVCIIASGDLRVIGDSVLQCTRSRNIGRVPTP